MDRPYTTLFLLSSVDGKISTGDTNEMDVDTDYPTIPGVKEGLSQYYALERETDLFSLNTGKVLEKIGVNTKVEKPEKIAVTFVVIDNQPHLNEPGVSYLAEKGKALIIVTTNPDHPANFLKDTHNNINIIFYESRIDFKDLFMKLKSMYGANRLTVQSGSTINAELVRAGLIDRVLFVVAPLLVGGKNTPSIMGGESLHSKDDLSKIRILELVQAKPLKDSYLLLEYQVKNQ